MLRTNIAKTVSQKDELILQTNHNFFIRTAIANVAKIILATIILGGAMIGINILNSTSPNIEPTSVAVFLIIIYIVYLCYFTATVSEIVTLYKKSIDIENEILGGAKTPKMPVNTNAGNSTSSDVDFEDI